MKSSRAARKRYEEARKRTLYQETGTVAAGARGRRWVRLELFAGNWYAAGLLRLGNASQDRQAIVYKVLQKDLNEIDRASDKYFYAKINFPEPGKNYRELEFEIYQMLKHRVEDNSPPVWYSGNTYEGAKLCWELKMWNEKAIRLSLKRRKIMNGEA